MLGDQRCYVGHPNPTDSQHGCNKIIGQDGDIIQQRKDLWCGELHDFDYDVLIVGHTHQVFAEQLGKVFVVNPGSSAFNHSCMILSLPELKVQIFTLENKDIIK